MAEEACTEELGTFEDALEELLQEAAQVPQKGAASSSQEDPLTAPASARREWGRGPPRERRAGGRGQAAHGWGIGLKIVTGRWAAEARQDLGAFEMPFYRRGKTTPMGRRLLRRLRCSPRCAPYNPDRGNCAVCTICMQVSLLCMCQRRQIQATAVGVLGDS